MKNQLTFFFLLFANLLFAQQELSTVLSSESPIESDLVHSRKKLTFAKEVVVYKPSGNAKEISRQFEASVVLGPPSLLLPIPDQQLLKIGCGGYLILDFGAKGVKDATGIDIQFFGKRINAENLVSVSSDGKDWVALDRLTEKSQGIDINGKLPSGEKFSYLKIENLESCGQGIPSDIQLTGVGIKTIRKRIPKQKLVIVDREIRTKSKQIILKVRDYKYMDGDVISLSINGKMVIAKKMLTKWNRKIKIDLLPGENRIKIKAIKQGFIKPNTAKVRVIDDWKIYKSIFRIRKGSSTSFSIIRESL